MTKKTRKILFFILLFVFIIIAPVVILYAQGYRFDFEKKRLIQTGDFYFKSLPKKANIYINNKLTKEKTPGQIKNLLPKKYNVQITKEGFWAWKKELEINPLLVTEAKNILLVPEKLNKETVIPAKISKFSFSPNKKFISYISQDKELRLYNLEDSEENPLFKSENYKLVDIIWSYDSKKILFFDSLNRWRAININEPSKIINISANLSNPKWNPLNPSEVFFKKGNDVFILNLENQKNQVLAAEDIVDYDALGEYLFYIQKPNLILYKQDILGKTKEQMTNLPMDYRENLDYKILAFSLQDIILRADGALYIFEKDKKLFEKIDENIKNENFASDERKISFWSSNEIWVFWLKKIFDQPTKNAGDKELITRLSQKIKEVIWYPKTSEHLIFLTEDNKIKIAELDGRDKRNTFDIAEGNNIKQLTFYDKWLYFLDGDSLTRINMDINGY